jgi:hypothetical protein
MTLTTFSPNTLIKSSEVNANFVAIISTMYSGKERTVLNGMTSSVTGSSLTLTVASGAYITYDTKLGTYAGGTITLSASPSSAGQFRFDLISLNSAGALVETAGTPQTTDTSLVVPTLPSNNIPLCVLRRDYGVTNPPVGAIWDVRVINGGLKNQITSYDKDVALAANYGFGFKDFLGKAYSSFDIEFSVSATTSTSDDLYYIINNYISDNYDVMYWKVTTGDVGGFGDTHTRGEIHLVLDASTTEGTCVVKGTFTVTRNKDNLAQRGLQYAGTCLGTQPNGGDTNNVAFCTTSAVFASIDQVLFDLPTAEHVHFKIWGNN